MHAAAIVDSALELDAVIRDLVAADDPLSEADRRIDAELTELKAQLQQHRPERVVELARIACLPWSIAGRTKPDTEGGLVKAELLALVALTSSGATTNGSTIDEPANELYQAAHGWAESIAMLVYLSEARILLELQNAPPDDLESISLYARTREVWIRNTSYPDMVQATHDLLFGHASIAAALSTALGFEAGQARLVLTSLDELQTDKMNDRMATSFATLGDAHQRREDPDAPSADEVRAVWNAAWQPTAEMVTYSPDAIAAKAGIDVAIVEAVLEYFTVDLGSLTPRALLDGFMAGDNPLRSSPVVRTEHGRFMLVHNALIQPAIRESLEQALKDLPSWDEYAKRRGDLLEDIGKTAFQKLLPGCETHLGFEYFVPATDAEGASKPDEYTKLVEGDLLLILDDVAVIVEAKAVAIIPAARAGETRKLRRNLTDIITKASHQATRLRRRIEQDGGIRLRNGAWLDLSCIREIHTVALSLEDLPGVATATSDLIHAGLLDGDDIPWVVSVHDLQTIAEIVDRPAEFLLYLRRRRHPEVSLAFSAPDELDLFLYFYERGLYVAPDPVKVAADLPYLSKPRTGDLRRRARQRPTFISTRTDALDAWHYARLDPSRPAPPKPSLSGSPMTGLVDEIQARGFYAWLSLGATLLSGSTKAQADWARIPKRLISKSAADRRDHSQTIPVGETKSDSWLLTWMSHSKSESLDSLVALARKYVRAKKYQLGIPRGAAFIFDQATSALLDVIYDGTPPTPDPELDQVIESLFPVHTMSSAPPPKRSATKPKTKRKRRTRRKPR